MDGFNGFETLEILCIEGQNAPHAVDEHSGNETSIMHLDSRYPIVHQQPTPFLVNCEAVRE
jgi:hypothetical protein